MRGHRPGKTILRTSEESSETWQSARHDRNGAHDGSQNAADSMMRAQIPAYHYIALDWGFSDFLRQPEAVEFLKT